MKTLLTLLLGLLFVLAPVWSSVGRAQGIPQDVRTVFERHVENLNRGDLTSVMEDYADDAVFQAADCARSPCVGKAAIQRAHAREIADHARITISDIEVSGETLTSRFEARSDLIRSFGVERIAGRLTVESRDGKISLPRAALDLSDAQTATYLQAQARAAQGGAAPTAGALPRSGGAPVGLLALLVSSLVGVGVSLRRLTSRR